MKPRDRKVEQVDIMIENTVASVGPDFDVDRVAEVSKLIKRQLVQHSQQAMLVQANAQPKAVLSLLA